LIPKPQDVTTQFARGQLLSGARQIGVDENRSMPFHQNWIDPPKEGSLKNTCSLLRCQSLVVGQQDRGFVLALNNWVQPGPEKHEQSTNTIILGYPWESESVTKFHVPEDKQEYTEPTKWTVLPTDDAPRKRVRRTQEQQQTKQHLTTASSQVCLKIQKKL
jgi:hypothetical protein